MTVAIERYDLLDEAREQVGTTTAELPGVPIPVTGPIDLEPHLP